MQPEVLTLRQIRERGTTIWRLPAGRVGDLLKKNRKSLSTKMDTLMRKVLDLMS